MNKVLYEARDYGALPDVAEAELKPLGSAQCSASSRWGTMLAVGCEDGSIVIYDMLTRGEAAVLRSEEVESDSASVTCVCWSRRGETLFAGYSSGSICRWAVADCSLRSTWQLGSEVLTVSASETDTPTLLATFAARRPLLFAPDGNRREVPTHVEGRLYGVIDRRQAFVALVGEKGFLTLLDVASLRVLDAVQVNSPAVRGLSLSADGRIALVTGAGGVRAVQLDKVIKAHASSAIPSTQLVASQLEPSKPLRASRGMKPPLVLGTLEYREAIDNYRIQWAHLSRDGEFLLGGAKERDRHVIYIWAAHGEGPGKPGRIIRVLEGAQVGLAGCHWHTDPSRLTIVSITTDGRVLVWAPHIAQNWSVFAPGFRTLQENEEHVESETEFDLQPQRTDEDEAEELLNEPLDVVTVPRNERFFLDSDTEADWQQAVLLPPLRIVPQVPVKDTKDTQAGTAGAAMPAGPSAGGVQQTTTDAPAGGIKKMRVG